MLEKARAALHARNPALASTYLSRASKLEPENGEMLFLKARVARRVGHLQKTRELLHRASSMGGDRAQIRREEWLAMAQMGQLSDSVPALFGLLSKQDSEAEDICEALVNGFFISFRFSEAFGVLDAWQEDYPRDPQPHLFRGLFAERQMRWKEAVNHFREAFQRDQNRRDIQLRLANSLIVVGELDEALNHFEYLVTNEPRNAGNWLGYGQLLKQRGQLPEAQTALETALRLEPENEKTLTDLGQMALDQLRTDQAIDYLRRAVDLNGSNPEARVALANALQKSGRSEEAAIHYQKVAQIQELRNRLQLLEKQAALEPKMVETRFEIADIFHQLGKPKERLAWLHSIVEIAPQESRVFPLLVEHFSQLGDHESARMYQRKYESVRLLGDHGLEVSEQRAPRFTPHETNP